MGILKSAEEAMRARGAPVFAAFPLFEYETNVVHAGLDDDLCRLDDFLNAKAALGWRVHTCQRVGEGSYFVVLDKLKGKM